MFTSEQMNIIQYCAEECKHQQSGELSVFNMIAAWNTLESKDVQGSFLGYGPDSPLRAVLILASLIEDRNSKGLRTTPVIIKAKVIGTENMERRLVNILDAAGRGAVTATDFYKEFEEIHPFEDGNGRLGLLLFNFYEGTMSNPAPKPEVVFSP